MSAMADSLTPPITCEPTHAPYPTLRDLLLALVLTILVALAIESTATTAPLPDPASVVQDWKGNSGTLS